MTQKIEIKRLVTLLKRKTESILKGSELNVLNDEQELRDWAKGLFLESILLIKMISYKIGFMAKNYYSMTISNNLETLEFYIFNSLDFNQYDYLVCNSLISNCILESINYIVENIDGLKDPYQPEILPERAG